MDTIIFADVDLIDLTMLSVMLVVGVVLCSLLCVVAAFYQGGEMLERNVIMLACQIYLVLIAFIQLSIAGGALVSQVSGLVVLVLGIAPAFLRKNNFQAARYCIAFGAVAAACAILLF